MRISEEVLLGLLVVILMLVFFALGVGAGNTGTMYKSEIIKHNCAEYDSKTGNFKWIEGK